MTLSESRHILDIVFDALQEETPHRHRPASALKGYDIYQICAAIKLQVANEFLLLAGRPGFVEKFAECVKFYEAGPWIVILSFVPDDAVDTLGARGVFDPIDPASMTFTDRRLADDETISSFGGYCKGLGPADPLFWQKIYTRIRLEYTATSPRRNDPLFPERALSG